VQERGLKPNDTFRECEGCPEMVVVPAGAFTMGSSEKEEARSGGDEGPQHVVTISKPFAVGKLHVTVDQFAAFVRETGYKASSNCTIGKEDRNGSWRNPGFAQEGSHPVVCLSWDDANAYVAWREQKTGKPYRLLTEAEWEYATRGQTSPGVYPRFWFGNDEKDLCRYANGSGSCDGYAHTSPAGHYQPNAFGLHDMIGNAWQWTADCWHNGYQGAPVDGSAWTTGCHGSGHADRGGSWDSPSPTLRSARREWDTGAYNYVGFRLARTLTP
jgi:formylglycine-generating enzyme required for sulfatase activity